ncbi:MAG: tight adherence protein C [Acidimicrobiales bacterium]|jgi:tight adherence protein C
MTAASAVLILIPAIVGVVAVVRRPVPRPPLVGPPLASPSQRSGFERIGRYIRSRFRQPADPSLDRSVGVGVVVALVIGLVNIGFAIVVAVGVWARTMLHRRRRGLDDQDRVGAALGDVIDLFAVALLSGNTVGDAVRQVSEWSDADIAEAFAWCSGQVAGGRSLSDALEQVPVLLGSQVRPLIAALIATERYGAPITTNLAQLAADTRAERRRRAEARARRLPVVLLFPLVTCVLPAFLLVTVVPVVIDTILSFDIVASP